jgi:hypothetical protein
MRSFFPLAALAAALVNSPGCGSDLPGACPRGKPITSVRSLDSRTVEVHFACQLDQGSASDPGHYEIGNFAVVPPATLAVEGSAVSDGVVRLSTAEQTALVTYTVRLAGVRDAEGNDLQGSANFVGIGTGNTAEVTFQVDDRYNASLKSLAFLTNVDPLTGLFSHAAYRIPSSDTEGDHLFETTLRVAVDPARTADTSDDRLGESHMAYSVRAVDEQNRPLSQLVLFEVKDETPQTVKVPLLNVPPPPPPEGLVTVTFKVDDRPARALSAPSLRGSFDADGKFDAGFPATVALSDQDGDDVWEGTAKVRIAPSRVAGGTTPESQPYSVYLVEGTTPYSARSADFTVPDEKAVSVEILIGSKDKVPIVFRVDASQAWLDPEGSSKGLYPGEAIFLTGEFGLAEDAFGQNATDAFNGGENVVLQMSERKDRPGVWERTIFLPQSRPYGWKVVRCPKDQGCTQLNKMVTSTGRAFPTVMKNLVTELCDASKTSWPDPECKSPKLIDPRALSQVDTGSGVLDYSSAKIFEGTGGGIADQKDPAGTPSASIMFKQEVPDLVVDVKDQPVETPVYVIGTWRDVNIPGTPADIITGGKVIALSKTDYDAGLIGVLPPSYVLPPAPKPSPFKMDGALDGTATLVAGGGNTMSLQMALSGNYLYLATDDAGEGSDHFILLSATAPGALRAAPWGKAGQVAFGGKTIFLADENDSDFAGWFELGPPDTLLASMGGGQNPALDVATPPQNGSVLEGTVDLVSLFGAVPPMVYVAVAPWATADGGSMYSAAQTPPTKDGNGNIDAGEILKVSLPSLKVVP